MELRWHAKASLLILGSISRGRTTESHDGFSVTGHPTTAAGDNSAKMKERHLKARSYPPKAFFLGGGGHTHSMRMFPSNPHPSCPWCHSSNHAQLPRLLLLSHREPRPPRVFTGARSHTAGPRERDQVTSVANPGPGTSEPRAAPVGKRPLTSSAFQKMPPKLVYFQMPLKGASLNFTKVLKKTALLT